MIVGFPAGQFFFAQLQRVQLLTHAVGGFIRKTDRLLRHLCGWQVDKLFLQLLYFRVLRRQRRFVLQPEVL